MRNRFLLSLILILVMLSLTGCWSYREIDKLALVSGAAIDKNDSSEGYEMTAEVIDSLSSPKESRFDSIRLESKGKTIFDCNRNMISISAKMMYWGHATTIIVSEDVAKDGILPILDWISRDSEPRLNLYIFISKADSAKELLSLQSISTKIRSFEFESMIVSNKKLSKVPNIQAYQLINDISNPGIYPVIPTLDAVVNEGKKTTELSGGAILDKGRLAGFMSLDDIEYYRFVRNQIESGLLIVDLEKDRPGDNMTLEIFKNKTKVSPKLSDGKLSISIKTKTQVAIGELDTSVDYITKDGLKRLTSISEQSLQNHILGTIKKIQKDFGLDVFGFGSIVKEQMPDLWKEIQDDWDDIFKTLDVEVDSSIHIRNTGHSSTTIKPY